jgi:predicted LPLAT superfamily acyltransferase
LFHFFAVRTGPGAYRFSASAPVRVAVHSRAERDAAFRRAAQAYADDLETIVRRHPDQWYTFEPFLGEQLAADGPSR